MPWLEPSTGGVLKCTEGRSSETWVDWNFFGHQLVTHKVDEHPSANPTNPVDGHAVPVPHFGVVLEMSTWEQLAADLRSSNQQFIIEPYVRFKGEAGEQATMFFNDPFGNALEFKSFADITNLFKK